MEKVGSWEVRDNENQHLLWISPHSVLSSQHPVRPRRSVHSRDDSRTLKCRHHSPCRIRRRLSVRRRIRFGIFSTLVFLLPSWILMHTLFFPSYTDPPAHYAELRRRVRDFPDFPGVANPSGQKVFIAAALYDPDGNLLSDVWATPVRRLIHILGPGNVFLSLYENDPSPIAAAALAVFRESLECPASVVTEPVDYSALPHVVTAAGQRRLKRMAFLAHVRNRALDPLETHPIAANTRWDRLLYLNDVIFDPVDAANLLLSTNHPDVDGADASSLAPAHPRYRAACAVDFISPAKFYDTFATRDIDGFTPGAPFFPWFTTAGTSRTRNAVLRGSDAVPVSSCWSGMVAFDAKPFLSRPSTPVLSHRPLRFRAENETYWDSSECCLIHADLAVHLDDGPSDGGSSIYLNPFIRVAYSSHVYDWLPALRRVEHLFTPVQHLVNLVARLPRHNPRRTHFVGRSERVRVWRASDEGYVEMERTAAPGGFCGTRSLFWLDEETGGERWGWEPAPAG